MKSRDESLKANWGTICTLVPLISEDGKKHKEMTTDTQGNIPLLSAKRFFEEQKDHDKIEGGNKKEE